jgi:hypothetical protein
MRYLSAIRRADALRLTNADSLLLTFSMKTKRRYKMVNPVTVTQSEKLVSLTSGYECGTLAYTSRITFREFHDKVMCIGFFAASTP